MRLKLLAATLVLFVSAAIVVGHRARAEKQPQVTSSIVELPDGHLRLSVLNSSGVPITALVALGTRKHLEKGTAVGSVRFFDSALDPFGRREINPGQTYIFTFFGPNPPPEQLKRDLELKAAIFADGTSWGDSQWVNTLLVRRSAAHRYNSEALQALETANSQGASLQRATGDLTQLRDSEFAAAKTTAEKQMAHFTFSEAMLFFNDATAPDGTAASVSESIARARSQLLIRVNRLKASKPNIVN